MKTEKREVYVSDDGQVFDNADACQAHERKIIAQQKRIEGLKVYFVTSGFDGTEGRGYSRRTYIITDATFTSVLHYCFDRFGVPLRPWYGTSCYEEWHIRETDFTATAALEKAKDRHYGVGDYAAKVDVIFLSDKDIDHDELPERTPFWRPHQKA